jgi:hypothetical protein
MVSMREVSDMACSFCTARHDEDGNECDLCGELAWDESSAACLDGRSSGRISMWHDEDGWSMVLVVDNTHDGARTVNRLPSVAALAVSRCPVCGRELP